MYHRLSRCTSQLMKNMEAFPQSYNIYIMSARTLTKFIRNIYYILLWQVSINYVNLLKILNSITYHWYTREKHKKSVSRICISLLFKQKYPYNIVIWKLYNTKTLLTQFMFIHWDHVCLDKKVLFIIYFTCNRY